jgi:hypothetical protein
LKLGKGFFWEHSRNSSLHAEQRGQKTLNKQWWEYWIEYEGGVTMAPWLKVLIGTVIAVVLVVIFLYVAAIFALLPDTTEVIKPGA